MGCDWYNIEGAVAYGIILSVEHIKGEYEIHSFQSAATGDESSDDDSEGSFDGLDEKTVEWLVEQTKGFHLYSIGPQFILVAPERLIELPGLSLAGPYEITDRPFEIAVSPGVGKEDLDSKLLEIARKLRPTNTLKLPFRPGTCKFHYTDSGMIKQIHYEYRDTSSLSDPEEASLEQPPTFVSVLDQDVLPNDVSLLVGKSDAQKTIQVNRAVVSCFVDGFDTLLGDKGQVELPDLEPSAVVAVINHHTTREKTVNPFPPRWGSMPEKEKQAIREVYTTLKGEEPPSKKVRMSPEAHAALTDTRWLDATFLVGLDKTEVKANRACLAAMNPVLKAMMYGSGQIVVDPQKPIEWPEFDPQAVVLVFQAVLSRGKTEVVIPVGLAEHVKSFLNFICESEKTVKVYFDTEYERKHGNGVRASFFGDDFFENQH